jgi:D-alanyl-D-alanine-carboxypeptidase/D-alanyl-D-alanine-endopeptidase
LRDRLTRDSLLKRKFFAALALGSIAAVARAQPVALADYQQHLQHGVEIGAYQQVAAGWLDAGARQTWFFGREAKPDLDSTFEIGAATEIFTGLALAQSAIDGKLRLQTTVREVLPKQIAIADAALGATTLMELATHHAGLPALPPNLLPANLEDPYADYSKQNLYALLANYRPPESPKPAYSPLDAGLLGELLGHTYATSFGELLDAKILKPLAMQHTGFDDAGLLAGHARDDFAAHWHFGALGAAAGLRSSVGDLLTFLQQNLQPQGSPLRAALLLARQAQAGTRQDVGLGWNIVEVDDGQQSWPLVWRASRTAGFATFLGFRTDRQQALVLLGNSDADLSALGLAWLQQRPPPPVPDQVRAVPDKIDWNAYPGLYRVQGGAEFIVRTGARGMSAQFRGQPAQALRAVGEEAFAGETLALAFTRHADKVTGALVDFGGAHVPAQRLSDHAPGLVRTPLDVPVPGELAGDYRLDADTLVRIRTGEHTLALQMTARAPLRLQPFAPDRYADADATCELAFQRDRKGAVSGLTLTLAGIDRTGTRVAWSAPAAQ